MTLLLLPGLLLLLSQLLLAVPGPLEGLLELGPGLEPGTLSVHLSLLLLALELKLLHLEFKLGLLEFQLLLELGLLLILLLLGHGRSNFSPGIRHVAPPLPCAFDARPALGSC